MKKGRVIGRPSLQRIIERAWPVRSHIDNVCPANKDAERAGTVAVGGADNAHCWLLVPAPRTQRVRVREREREKEREGSVRERERERERETASGVVVM